MSSLRFQQPAGRAAPRRGFTLIELLMVVAVVGTMMAIVVPKFRISAETEVQLAAMQLAQDVDLARTRALTTRTGARVAFDVTGKNYSGYLDVDDNGSYGETQAEKVALRGFSTRALPTRIAFGIGGASPVPDNPGSGPITLPGTRVDFDSRGLTTPMGAGGVIYLRHEVTATAVAAVVVSPAGSVRLWTWHNGGWQ